MNEYCFPKVNPMYKLIVEGQHVTTFRPFNFQVVQTIEGVRYNFLKVDHKERTIRAEVLN